MVALHVLTDRALFLSITGFAPGVPYFTCRIVQQLACAAPGARIPHFNYTPEPEDVALWQNAVLAGDKRTLEVLAMLATTRKLRRPLEFVLKGISSFTLMQANDKELFMWMKANQLFPRDCLERSTYFALGERNDKETLQWVLEKVLENKYPGIFFEEVAFGAASSGHLDMLQFVQSLGPELAGINALAIRFAAGNGQLEALKFLFQVLIPEGWARSTNFNTKLQISQGMTRAIQSGQLHIVQYLRENKYLCGEDHIATAAIHGHAEILKYLQGSGLSVYSMRGLVGAVRNGHLEVVKYLYELNPGACISVGGFLTTDAAERGHLELIKFFHECGEPRFFDWRAMNGAAVNGHLDVVKFLHENRDEGCQSSTLKDAHEKGFHDVVEYLCENRPAERAGDYAESARCGSHEDLAETIERGAAVAESSGRKRFRYA